MESLKKFEEIHEKDTRQSLFIVMDANQPGVFRPQVLQDFHRAAERIRLHGGVPEEIRNHFQTARNLIIYSWFYYPFNITAQLCAYTSVEFALKIREGKSGKKSSFRNLLQKAVAHGWISDAGFTVPRQRKERIRQYNEGMPAEFKLPEVEMVSQYSATLAETIPFLRNSIAHGTSMLHNHGATHVRVCAELINQLFPAPKKE